MSIAAWPPLDSPRIIHPRPDDQPMITPPIFPASDPATVSFNGLMPKSNFLKPKNR
jgi:hypothetical protein